MFAGLFSKPSAIDNEKLVAEKKRTIVQLKKKERKDKKRQERKEQQQQQQETEAQENEEAAGNSESEESVDENEDEDDGELEDRYMKKLLEDEAEESEEEEEEEEEDDDDDENEGEDNEKDEKDEKEGISFEDKETDAASESKSTTIKSDSSSKKSSTAAQVLDLKDKEFEKAERTIFIGNVPAVIMSNKKETKNFKQFINKFLEAPENTSFIDSIRFRSLHSTTTAPRKVAYIAKDVDLENVMNSYVVFKKKEDSMKALKLNGVVYKDHHLRVDHLTHPTKKDNKLSIFVGNLDFQEKEESLWKYFNEKLIAKEDRKDIKNIIDNVRIVRDSKTSFGKGFAIVQFIDTNYVTKALLLDGKKMGKRSLRITRCKKVMRNNEKMRTKFSKLNDQQKTVVGRAKQLGKIDRRTLGKVVIEGERATKGQSVGGLRGKKRRSEGGRKERRANANKKARITKRSQSFKEKNESKN